MMQPAKRYRDELPSLKRGDDYYKPHAHGDDLHPYPIEKIRQFQSYHSLIASFKDKPHIAIAKM